MDHTPVTVSVLNHVVGYAVAIMPDFVWQMCLEIAVETREGGK